jgi:hypothetical protein
MATKAILGSFVQSRSEHLLFDYGGQTALTALLLCLLATEGAAGAWVHYVVLFPLSSNRPVVMLRRSAIL